MSNPARWQGRQGIASDPRNESGPGRAAGNLPGPNVERIRRGNGAASTKLQAAFGALHLGHLIFHGRDKLSASIRPQRQHRTSESTSAPRPYGSPIGSSSTRRTALHNQDTTTSARHRRASSPRARRHENTDEQNRRSRRDHPVREEERRRSLRTTRSGQTRANVSPPRTMQDKREGVQGQTP